MRTDVELKTGDGVILRGWHYRPEGGGPWPTIVMAHGFSAVKEMYLDRFAEVFARAGLAALVFDNRNFGASDGEPRQEIDPWQQIADYRDAISFALTLPDTDPARIGVWGSSYSGAHVLVLGATDRRIRCVASQVRLIRADMIAPVLAMCAEDRLKRYRGEAPAMLPVVSEDPAGPAALPTPDSWRWFTETGRTRAPSWNNEVTLRSVELFLAYEPGAYIELISPTPLLLVVALGDHLTVADEALGAYERARQPKWLVTLKGGHFDAYVADFDAASGAARDWFALHLTG
jgi:fermentation-respiration switch protein FrsA (DUF1100 family)